MYELIMKFQEDYPTKEAKEKALSVMTDAQIDELIADSPNIYQKIFLSSFKKNNGQDTSEEQSAESGASSELNSSLK